MQTEGKPQHRVSKYYMDAGTSLGDDFLTWVDAGNMSDELDYQIAALEHVYFDGSTGEAMHKDLHRVAITSTGSSFRFQCASVRLQQNLSDYDLLCNSGMSSRFSMYWMRHKAVFQRKAYFL